MDGSTADALVVRVTSQTKSKKTPITAECYIPDGTKHLKIASHIHFNIFCIIGITNFNANRKPVRILAKVMMGTNPVIGAKVR